MASIQVAMRCRCVRNCFFWGLCVICTGGEREEVGCMGGSLAVGCMGGSPAVICTGPLTTVNRMGVNCVGPLAPDTSDLYGGVAVTPAVNCMGGW